MAYRRKGVRKTPGSALSRDLAQAMKDDAKLFEISSAPTAKFIPNDDLMSWHRWVIMRKKIGLTRTAEVSSKKIRMLRDKRKDTETFIVKVFERLECKTCSERSNLEKDCVCGRKAIKFKNDFIPLIPMDFIHETDAQGFENKKGDRIKSKDKRFDEFLSNLNLGNFRQLPTNAFGQVFFESEREMNRLIHPNKYVRLAPTADMMNVLTLLKDHWEILPNPNSLVLHFIGGSRRWSLSKELWNSVARFITCTKALVFTNGLDEGVAKEVADAVRNNAEAQTGLNSSHFFLCGIVPWGFVRANEMLINIPEFRWNNASYEVDEFNASSENAALEKNHSHFLLIDNGYSGIMSYSGLKDIQFKLFKLIVNYTKAQYMTILFGGSLEDLKDFQASVVIHQSIGVVVQGSGGIADVIASAMVVRSISKWSIKENKQLRESLFAEFPELIDRWEDTKAVLGDIEACLKRKNCLIVKAKRPEEVDKFLLLSLLDQNSQEKTATLSDRFIKAMAWNRSDLVRDSFELGKMVPDRSLDHVMTTCLMDGNAEVIDSLIRAGFSVKKYLTQDKLRHLYSEVKRTWRELDVQLSQFVPSYVSVADKVYLSTVNDYLSLFLGYHVSHLYESDEPSLNELFEVKKIKKVSKIDYGALFRDPYSELFLWSVICKRKGVIMYLWKRSDQPILMAEIAAAIYNRLSQFYTKAEHNEKIEERRDQFEALANQLMVVAYSLNRVKTFSLLESRYSRIGNRTLIQLAYYARLRGVIANPQCQSAVQINWKRGFTKLGLKSCFLCMFCPLLLFTPLVKFAPGLGDDGGSLSPVQKLFTFYRAPMTKFVANAVSALLFATLHSYVSLFNYRYDYQLSEILLYFWILIKTISEAREILTEHSNSFIGKMRAYLVNIWNVFDTLFLLFAAVTFVLRHFFDTFWLSRILFAFNNALAILMLFRYYHASWNLGPKLVIINDMFPELIAFAFLLFIFILAYGVASQAIIDPYRPETWDSVMTLVREALLLPYWQMYGELSLERITVSNISTCQVGDTPPDYCVSDLEHFEDYNRVTPIFLGIFLLFANVLLINLLIAVFTSVFEAVNSRSMEVWKWEMFRLVEEFDRQPALAPPLIIIEEIYMLFKRMWKNCCRASKEDLDYYLEEANEELRTFEKSVMAAYLDMDHNNERNSTDQRIQDIQSCLKEAENLPRSIDKLQRQVKRIEDTLQDVLRSLSRK